MKYYRTGHIPITAIQGGGGLELMADRAGSTFYRDDCKLDKILPRYSLHVVTSGEEFDTVGMAARLYNRPSLYWLIGLYNGMWCPTTQMEAGVTIKLPSAEDVERYIDILEGLGPRASASTTSTSNGMSANNRVEV